MTILAIDASSPILGVALANDGVVVALREEDTGSRHIERVSILVDAVLEDAAGRVPDAVAVAEGPGSFTGLRVAMAAAKGYSLSWGVPLVSVDSLTALAATEERLRHEAGTAIPALIVPILDARKGRFYAARYRVHDEGVVPAALDAPLDLTPDALAALIAGEESSWCAPGPLSGSAIGAAIDVARREEAVAAGRSGAIGLSLAGTARAERGQTEGPRHAPRYIRRGDIGTPRKRPRFG